MPHRVFTGLLAFLRENTAARTQAQQAAQLGLSQPQVSTYGLPRRAPTTSNWWSRLFGRIYSLGYRNGQKDATSKLMKGLVETFGEIPQSELATALGITQPAVSGWLRGSTTPSKRNFERLLGLHVIRLVEPIVEFRPIVPLKNGQAWRFYSDRSEQEKLRELLREEVGIYVFYDSAGRVTYIGKTERCLWGEPKQRLKATLNREFYKPTKSAGVVQGEVARYISAYRVRVPAAIHNLEVLMLRAVPNDAANTNTGKFKRGY